MNVLNKLHAYDDLYPDEQAGIEARRLKRDCTPDDAPAPKMIEISEAAVDKGKALGMTCGYERKVMPIRKTAVFDPSAIKMGYTQNSKPVKIDYETVNTEKMRHTSGYRTTVSEEEFLRLPAANKMNLAGFRQPFLTKPAPTEMYGNIGFQDANARAGYERIVHPGHGF